MIERLFVNEIFFSAFRGTPTVPVWEWADEHVWYSEKMAADESRYRSEKTPWTREWQDLPRQRGVKEAFAMKSSQSGFTEATLNVCRWMPDNWPGNVGYIINSDKKAKNISKHRLKETIRDCAEDQVTDDPNDQSTYQIVLKNMMITVSGSGSANAFRETWYRLGVLDEPEDHETLKDGTTSYDSIQGRFTTVEDALLLVLGKPQHAGGPVHKGYLKGTQEKWLVPCPHCDERIELKWEFLKFNHCRDLADGWDLERVVEETYYECQCCGEAIHESSKKEMVNAGEWHPTPEKDRERSPEGKPVPREPGVRSFHISDIYSLFPGVSWGQLAKKWLMAYKLQPNKTAQDAFQTEHMGRPIAAIEVTFRDDTIQNLRGGLVEVVDGKNQQLGEKFGLVYQNHELVGELPVMDPVMISVTGDRQKDSVPYLVFCWDKFGQSYLIDYGFCDDEEHFLALKDRPYPAPGGKHTYTPFGGLIDSRYRHKDVWRMCLEAQAQGYNMMPSRGSGPNSLFKGRNLRLVEKAGYTHDGWPVDVWEYYDHGVKCDFYLGKISRRDAPRLWLPDPVPKSILTHWTSEKFVKQKYTDGRIKDVFIHDHALGPNDLGDCGKKQFVYWQIVAPFLAEELVAMPR